MKQFAILSKTFVQVLERVSQEKETAKEEYEKQMEQERKAAGEREFAMKKEYGNKLNELERQYTQLKEHFDEKLDEENEALRKVGCFSD